jgi:NAD(P)-dependent dehydrogenase (short-subunit alcohol dehydrogenase family)
MALPTILITGAARGLGAAAALAAANLGANVVLAARSEAELEKVAEEVRRSGREALVVPGDVAQRQYCRHLVEMAAGHYGRIDALINNAGVIQPVARLMEIDTAAWEQNLAVNLFGPVALTHFALPYLRQSRGRVLNVSSGAAASPVAGWSAYCAAKAALNMFNQVLAVEEGEITAVAFRPGVVDTEMQALVRHEGKQGMGAVEHGRFLQYHEQGELLPPELPGHALAVLALYAPQAWSGQFLAWNDTQVESLVQQHQSVYRG